MDTRVTITDIDIPFGRLVMLIIKLWLASIPAIIIIGIVLAIVGGILSLIFGGILGALFGGLRQFQSLVLMLPLL